MKDIEDLKRAIQDLRPQYYSVPISEFTSPNLEAGTFTVVPRKPFAKESWAAGGKLKLSISLPENASEEVWLDISEYNPETGAILCYQPEKELAVEKVLQYPGYKLTYSPYDFSEALHEAFKRIEESGLDISEIVKLTCGAAAPRVEVLGTKVDKTPADVWNERWGIIWGPPGTGKTYSLAAEISKRIIDGTLGKTLVICPTNRAVDAIAMQTAEFLQRENRLFVGNSCVILRGGAGAGKDISTHQVYKKCLHDASYAAETEPTRKRITELTDQCDEYRFNGDFENAARLKKQITDLKNLLQDETEYALRQGAVKVVFTTHYKALTLVGKTNWPDYISKVVIDEAGMVSRAITLMAATMGRSTILAGDPKQIGPIYSRNGIYTHTRTWLISSGLSHLHSAKDSQNLPNVCLLQQQRRMVPEICAPVSIFTYDGLLGNHDLAVERGEEPPCGPDLPERRASLLLVDRAAKSLVEAGPKRPKSGDWGWERPLSADIAIKLTRNALGGAKNILILTPYNAQVQLLRKEIKETFRRDECEKVKVGTIHRHQGDEADVVILDTVSGMRRWELPDRHMLLNVAASRAKKHFIMLSSKAELRVPALDEFSSLLPSIPYTLLEDGVVIQPALEYDYGRQGKKSESPIDKVPENYGQEIAQRTRTVIPSQEQSSIIEKRLGLGQGHFFVRGVAGSGKSLILSHWVIRALQFNPEASILVTYFNKSLKNLLESMIASAAKFHAHKGEWAKNVEIINADKLREAKGKFDAVFVDEAQDLGLKQLTFVYNKCRDKEINGEKFRDFVLFHDDSQNLYAKNTLEDFKKSQKGKLEFGKKHTAILKETYRSTKNILSFALNLALDPKNLAFDDASGLLGFMNVADLANDNLLVRPEDSEHGIYEVGFCEKTGIAPVVVGADKKTIYKKAAEEIQRLHDEEHVKYGDIIVIAAKSAHKVHTELDALGIKESVVFNSSRRNTQHFPADGAKYVRCTTIHSCKGHEAPVVIFIADEHIENLSWMEDKDKKIDPKEYHKRQRCMLYVGASRAMSRLYFFGLEGSRFLTAAKFYSEALRLTFE